MIIHNSLIWFIIYTFWFQRRKAVNCIAADNRGESIFYNVLDGDNKSHLTILDLKDKFSTKKIHYTFDPDNEIHTYSAKKPYLLDTVKKGNNVVWSHEEGPYPEYVIIFKDENDESVVRIFFPSDASSRSDPSFNKSEISSIYSHLDRYQIIDAKKKLIYLDLKNTSNTQLIRYKFAKETDTHTFTSVLPYLFGVVRKGNTIVWEPENDNYPHRVLVFPDSTGNYTLRMIFPEETPPKAKSDVTPEIIEPDLEPPIRKTPSMHSVEDSSEPLPVELSIDYRWSHPKFEYTQADNVGTYRCRHGYAFSRVTSDDKFLFFKSHSVLWQGLAYTEFARKVNLVKYEFDEMFEITLYLLSGIKKKFVKHKDLSWTAIDLSQINPVVVSVRSVYDTYSYTNRYSGKVRTLTPKPHFAFSGIRDGTDVIWHTLDPDHYSNRINIIGKTFIIHFKDGSEKFYELVEDVWNEKPVSSSDL